MIKFTFALLQEKVSRNVLLRRHFVIVKMKRFILTVLSAVVLVQPEPKARRRINVINDDGEQLREEQNESYRNGKRNLIISLFSELFYYWILQFSAYLMWFDLKIRLATTL